MLPIATDSRVFRGDGKRGAVAHGQITLAHQRLTVRHACARGRTVLAGSRRRAHPPGAIGTPLPGAVDRIRAAQFGRVLTSDSIPFGGDPSWEVASVALLLAGAVRRLCGRGAEGGRP